MNENKCLFTGLNSIEEIKEGIELLNEELQKELKKTDELDKISELIEYFNECLVMNTINKHNDYVSSAILIILKRLLILEKK